MTFLFQIVKGLFKVDHDLTLAFFVLVTLQMWILFMHFLSSLDIIKCHVIMLSRIITVVTNSAQSFTISHDSLKSEISQEIWVWTLIYIHESSGSGSPNTEICIPDQFYWHCTERFDWRLQKNKKQRPIVSIWLYLRQL